MTDTTPRAAHRRRNRAAYEACAAALGTTPEAFAAQVDLEIAASYPDDDDAVGAAYLALADRRDLPGPKPHDALAAAARRGSPRHWRRTDACLRQVLYRYTDHGRWQDQVLTDYPDRMPVLDDDQVADHAAERGIKREVALAELRALRLRKMALDDAAWALYPADTRCGRKARKRYRDRVTGRFGISVPPKCNRHSHASTELAPQMEFAGADWEVTT